MPEVGFEPSRQGLLLYLLMSSPRRLPSGWSRLGLGLGQARSGQLPAFAPCGSLLPFLFTRRAIAEWEEGWEGGVHRSRAGTGCWVRD